MIKVYNAGGETLVDTNEKGSKTQSGYIFFFFSETPPQLFIYFYGRKDIVYFLLSLNGQEIAVRQVSESGICARHSS